MVVVVVLMLMLMLMLIEVVVDLVVVVVVVAVAVVVVVVIVVVVVVMVVVVVVVVVGVGIIVIGYHCTLRIMLSHRGVMRTHFDILIYIFLRLYSYYFITNLGWGVGPLDFLLGFGFFSLKYKKFLI